MSQSQLFFDTAIRPYIEPFYDLLHQTMGKLFAAALYTMFMGVVFMEQLFSTPELWWKGLAILVILDFASGNLRVLTDSRIKFDIRRWGRTGYKVPSYVIAGLAVGAGANMFPSSLGWAQYVTFAVLSGMEIFSILRNLKLFALAAVLSEVLMDRYNLVSLDQLKREVDDRSYQSYKDHGEDTFRKRDNSP